MPFIRGSLKESLREASPLLDNPSPFPLSRGRGTKGDGVTEQNPKGGEVDKQSLKVAYDSTPAR